MPVVLQGHQVRRVTRVIPEVAGRRDIPGQQAQFQDPRAQKDILVAKVNKVHKVV